MMAEQTSKTRGIADYLY